MSETAMKKKNSRVFGSGEGDWCAVAIPVLFYIVFFPLWLLSGIKVVNEYQTAVVFRLGKLLNLKGYSGLVLTLPCIDNVTVVDRRTKSVDVPPQAIITRDQITVMVDAVVDFNIRDVIGAVTEVENFEASTLMMAQTTLRNVLGEQTLHGILSDANLGKRVTSLLDQVTNPWGIKVERVNIKNIILPREMQRSMAATAEENQRAKARAIQAAGEREAAANLKVAADELAKSGGTIQLRYLQTISSLADRNNATIVMPFPNEMLID